MIESLERLKKGAFSQFHLDFVSHQKFSEYTAETFEGMKRDGGEVEWAQSKEYDERTMMNEYDPSTMQMLNLWWPTKKLVRESIKTILRAELDVDGERDVE